MHIYALLVGINDYAPSVGKLRGSINDVEEYREFLKTGFDPAKIDIEVLTDAEATRDNIIFAFRNFLGRAGKDDVVLFQYSGHGARWKSAGEFRTWFPDGFDEGLICYDSRRTSESWDLADKELAILLHELSQKDPHIAVILDCCHSGSGTRSADHVRQMIPRSSHTIKVPRPLESYLDDYYGIQLNSGQTLLPPSSRHLLMAGCDRYGQAFETPDQRGFFSQTLLQAMERTGMDVSYAELFLRVRSLVRKAASGQSPQFESYQGFNAYSGFLNRMAITGGKRFSVHYVDWDSWYVDCGAINGLSSEMDAPLELQLFADETSTAALGRAVSTAIGLNQTTLEVTGFKPDKRKVYSAELTSVPRPKLAVFVSGDKQGVETLISTSAHSEVIATAFQWEQDSPSGLRYAVYAVDDGYQIRFSSTDRLIQFVQGVKATSCEHVIHLLNRITNWEHARHLQNPSPGVDKSVVDFCYSQIDDDGSQIRHQATEVTFDIVKHHGAWSEVSGKILGQNKTDQRLHLMLVWFTEDFRVSVLYNEPHERDDEPFVFQLNVGDDIYEEMGFCLDDDEGNRAVHTLKLFVSKDKIDDFLLEQPPMEIGATVQPLEPHQTRGGKFRKKLPQVSWFTREINITLVRQIAEVGHADADLANGQIRFKPHPALKAGATLLPASESTRSSSENGFTVGLAECGLELLNFSTARGEDQSVLEINRIENPESLSDAPLEIELDIPLSSDEYIVPLIFDGEHLLLAGDTWKDPEGATRVEIRNIPEMASTSRRPFSAMKLYFFKAVCGLKHVNSLCRFEIQDGKVCGSSKSGLGESIHAAERILLLVHGLFGDSGMMADQVSAILARTEDPVPFDLVLGYDYETINTPIEESARELKSLLKMKGLDERSTKHVTVVAHSTGGLVARWFIEKEKGNGVVDHLVMCGTPNEGAPFGSVGLATTAISNLATLALDMLPKIAKEFIRPLQEMLSKRSLVTTLSQVAANSAFMHELNTSDDPNVRYSILAGDIHDYVESTGDDRFNKLILKIGSSGSFDRLFGHQPHDVAVSVDSMRAVLDSRSPAPEKTNLTCHHLNYLFCDQGISALSGMGGEKTGVTGEEAGS